ncbi:MAG: efflux RND transporter periplasmic adaptor subunit [Planctomycetes bacterium]|nr:efflux RND transporter periplasmic adaptor subunit [Planctomycetota bacterium]
MKRAVTALVIAALVGVLGWRIAVKVKEGGGNDGRGPRRAGFAVAVEISPVEKATVREVSLFTGTLQPRARFVVSPKIAGRLEKLTVDVGDAVRSGDLIAELDDAEYAQQAAQARAELAVARASVAECKSTLEMAERELERVKALREKKVASESELDEQDARYTAARAKHAVALAEVTRREAALKAAEVRLSYTRIRVEWPDADAPRVVGERFVDEGEMLQPNAPIVSVLDNNVMIAQIDVIERDYPRIRIGQPAVLITDGFPDREFTGRILRIAPLLKELSRQARVEIELANEDGVLKPGMFVRARIEFDRHADVTVVPVAALARRDGHQGVFVADTAEKKARFVPVKAGITEGERVEIVEPALSGSVVTLGHHLLEDGAAIALPGEEPAAGAGAPGPGSRGGRAGGGR